MTYLPVSLQKLKADRQSVGEYNFGPLTNLRDLNIKVYGKGESVCDKDMLNLSKDVELKYVNSKNNWRSNGQPAGDD